MNENRIVLHTDESSGASSLVVDSLVAQELMKYLKANGVEGQIGERAVSDGAGDGDDSINFGIGADVKEIQRLLDKWQS